MKAQSDEIRESAVRWLGLLLAPAAISLIVVIVTDLATNLPTPWWLWIITIIVIAFAILFYFVGYHNRFEKIVRELALKNRSKRFSRPYILVLNGTIEGVVQESPPVNYHTDRNPTDWRTAFEGLGWDVEVGSINQMQRSRKPDIVLNPFGEVYPEADFNSNSTGILIREYVWRGGVYVNVSGIPFWYRHNPRTGETETAGRIERVAEGNPQWKTLFKDLFPMLEFSQEHSSEKRCFQSPDDISRFGEITNKGGKNTLGVFRSFPLRSGLIIPILRDDQQQSSIIGGYLYGEGCYLFSSTFIEGDNTSFEKIVAAVEGWAAYEKKGRKP